MTTIRTSFIAALGLLVAGSMAPAAAAPTAAKGVANSGDAAALHLVTDRGSWAKPKSRWMHDRDYGYSRGHDRYDDYGQRRHHKKKKVFKRGYKRGYSRGYDEGYYEGRSRSRFGGRGRHRHYYPEYGFRGGIYFGDGNFRFRY